MIKQRSRDDNNLEYCNNVAPAACEETSSTASHAYHLLDGDDELDECYCTVYNRTDEITNDNQTISCYKRKLWDFIGDCRYSLYVGKEHTFSHEIVKREKRYSLHYTVLSRAAAQYSIEAESLYSVNPSEIEETMPVSYILNKSIPYEQQCEALASSGKVHRYSVNTQTGLCLLVYYVEDAAAQRLREETQS